MGDMRRGFFWTQKAWYAKTTNEQGIMFGMYDTDSGTDGEMSMVWEELGGEQVPQLRVFSDTWKVLTQFQDLLQELANVDGIDISQEQFVAILKGCGFEDLTPYEDPYKDAPLISKLIKECGSIQERMNEISDQLEELNAD